MVHGVRDISLAEKSRANVVDHRDLGMQNFDGELLLIPMGRRIDGAHPSHAEHAVESILVAQRAAQALRGSLHIDVARQGALPGCGSKPTWDSTAPSTDAAS